MRSGASFELKQTKIDGANAKMEQRSFFLAKNGQ
jgi:hypothetical protein